MQKLEGGKFICCGLTFRRDQITTPDNQPLVVYSQDNGKPDSFMVRVSKQGMTFQGSLEGFVSSESEVQDLAEFMSMWVDDVRRLRPRIFTTESGH